MASKLSPERLAKRRKRLIRAGVSILAGIALGQLCPMLPPAQQAICHLAAKLVSLLVGGSP